MNKVILIGNVGGTPEVRTLENGVKVANFSIATTERYTDKKGAGGVPQKVEQTEWHRLEVWNGLAKVAETIIKKGDRLCIEGKIKTEKWEDSDGNQKTAVKIRVERIELLGNRREQVEKEAEPVPSEKSSKKGNGKEKKIEIESSPVIFVATTGEGDLPF